MLTTNVRSALRNRRTVSSTRADTCVCVMNARLTSNDGLDRAARSVDSRSRISLRSTGREVLGVVVIYRSLGCGYR